MFIKHVSLWILPALLMMITVVYVPHATLAILYHQINPSVFWLKIVQILILTALNGKEILVSLVQLVATSTPIIYALSLIQIVNQQQTISAALAMMVIL